MKAVGPYLNFSGNTEEAFNFYRSVFGGDFLGVHRFGDLSGNPMGVPEHELDRIANIALPLGNGTVLMGTDVLEGWEPLKIGNNFYITLETDSEEEADRLFAALSAGGHQQMELQRTAWAEKYGTCIDRFGIQWMVMYTGDVQFPAPQS